MHQRIVRRKRRETYLSAIRTLVALMDLRESDTCGHSERVCTYAAAIGSQTLLGATTTEMTSHIGAIPGPPGDLKFYKVLPAECGVAIFPCDIGPCFR